MRQRVITPELMDDPSLDPALLRDALTGLGRLNTVSMAGPLLWRVVATEARRADKVIRVLDVGCAGGEWVVGAAARAARSGLRAEFSGCDFNPALIAMAGERAHAAGLRCSFFVHDIIRAGDLDEYDVVMSSLMLHHLSDRDARFALSAMRAASRGLVVVNDLVRSRLNLSMVGAASRTLTRSPVVRTDALLSVRAAFTRRELLQLAAQSGLQGARIGPGGFGRMMLLHRRGQ